MSQNITDTQRLNFMERMVTTHRTGDGGFDHRLSMAWASSLVRSSLREALDEMIDAQPEMDWRLRRGWFGRQVLQRYTAAEGWRDASEKDLSDYHVKLRGVAK